MKKFLLGTVALAALASAPALAADLPARAYTKAPPMIAPVYDWTGFYVGINGGWSCEACDVGEAYEPPDESDLFWEGRDGG